MMFFGVWQSNGSTVSVEGKCSEQSLLSNVIDEVKSIVLAQQPWLLQLTHSSLSVATDTGRRSWHGGDLTRRSVGEGAFLAAAVWGGHICIWGRANTSGWHSVGLWLSEWCNLTLQLCDATLWISYYVTLLPCNQFYGSSHRERNQGPLRTATEWGSLNSSRSQWWLYWQPSITCVFTHLLTEYSRELSLLPFPAVLCDVTLFSRVQCASVYVTVVGWCRYCKTRYFCMPFISWTSRPQHSTSLIELVVEQAEMPELRATNQK